ncbi:unnamed protein product [Parascedosporium putredinis]|uniref:Uncharacterized protein n=1 Tax=Parascedosporium putredinis TaxID=1442378 RepID=A0A9P1GXK9_9PEZI|nr:unnamed protein product [Parascedosporium putredinis]CAI7990711.1 unnamed protein product [Parascedosporium putredinis]
MQTPSSASASTISLHLRQYDDRPESPAEPLSAATKACIISGIENRKSADRIVCVPCYEQLSEPQRANLRTTSWAGGCPLCLVKEDKPEAYTKPFCDFLTENPTVFHAVEYFKEKLTAAGFEEIKPGGKYWVTRNGSSIIAFSVGRSYVPGSGVAMIAGHIDALTARLRPISKKPNKAGYVQLGVAPYAGALNQTWWDRDLGIGGRVIVKDPETGKTSIKLVKLDWPIARIPTVAPHFGAGMMGQNNKETQAVPIIGLEDRNANAETAELIAKELGIEDYSLILNWELELFDSQPAQTGGLDREFIFGGRIDDKLCSWPALIALLSAADDEDHAGIKLVALFDDEEIGSLLRQGARGNFLPIVIERTTYARSFLASADVTHAGNPNFLGLYLDEHVPRLNVGVAICADSNGHMTTDAVSTAILQRIAQLEGCETQIFQIRNDTRSGGTVGPMLSSAMGVKAADLGLPQLSMHSIRATTGALDPGLGVRFFRAF